MGSWGSVLDGHKPGVGVRGHEKELIRAKIRLIISNLGIPQGKNPS